MEALNRLSLRELEVLHAEIRGCTLNLILIYNGLDCTGKEILLISVVLIIIRFVTFLVLSEHMPVIAFFWRILRFHLTQVEFSDCWSCCHTFDTVSQLIVLNVSQVRHGGRLSCFDDSIDIAIDISEFQYGSRLR